jgi:hypothetical protein
MQPQPANGVPYQPQPYPQGTMLGPQFTGGAYASLPAGGYPQPPDGVYLQPPAGVYHQPPAGAYYQPAPPQAQPMGAPQTYYTAVPIIALSQGPAPVDCPVCRKRALTMIEFQAGNTTQWVFCPFFSFRDRLIDGMLVFFKVYGPSFSACSWRCLVSRTS